MSAGQTVTLAVAPARPRAEAGYRRTARGGLGVTIDPPAPDSAGDRTEDAAAAEHASWAAALVAALRSSADTWVHVAGAATPTVEPRQEPPGEQPGDLVLGACVTFGIRTGLADHGAGRIDVVFADIVPDTPPELPLAHLLHDAIADRAVLLAALEAMEETAVSRYAGWSLLATLATLGHTVLVAGRVGPAAGGAEPRDAAGTTRAASLDDARLGVPQLRPRPSTRRHPVASIHAVVEAGDDPGDTVRTVDSLLGGSVADLHVSVPPDGPQPTADLLERLYAAEPRVTVAACRPHPRTPVVVWAQAGTVFGTSALERLGDDLHETAAASVHVAQTGRPGEACAVVFQAGAWREVRRLLDVDAHAPVRDERVEAALAERYARWWVLAETCDVQPPVDADEVALDLFTGTSAPDAKELAYVERLQWQHAREADRRRDLEQQVQDAHARLERDERRVRALEERLAGAADRMQEHRDRARRLEAKLDRTRQHLDTTRRQLTALRSRRVVRLADRVGRLRRAGRLGRT